MSEQAPSVEQIILKPDIDDGPELDIRDKHGLDDAQANELRSRARELSKIDEGVHTRADLGSLGFSSELPLIQAITQLSGQLSVASMRYMPSEPLRSAIMAIAGLESSLIAIRSATPHEKNRNWSADRETLIRGLHEKYHQALTAALPILSYSGLVSKTAGAVKALSLMRAEIAEIEKLRERGEAALASLQKATELTGVTRHASQFQVAADSFRKAAQLWLGVAVFLFIGAVALAMYFLFSFHLSIREVSTGEAFQIIAYKLALMSFVLTATFWAGRNYKANRHNAIVNEHRQTALQTFEAFVTSTNEQRTKDAVLLQATQCIFSPQPTGYLGSRGETSPPVLEIIRTLGSEK